MDAFLDVIASGTFYNGIPIPEDWPNWLKKIAASAETVEYNGKTYTYAVVRRDYTDEARSLPGFVAVHGEHVVVSEDVTEEDRPYYALHEIVEMTDLKGQEGRCRQALIIELEHVPEDMYSQYVLRRIRFFERLVDFHEMIRVIPSEALEEMRSSLRYLTLPEA